MSAGYVIMRSTGEYSDRTETPIRFVLTEAEAKRLVTLADIQIQKQPELPELPHETQPHRGNWKNLTPEQHEENRKFHGDRWERHETLLRALGYVDPLGPQSGATYSYEKVFAYVDPASK